MYEPVLKNKKVETSNTADLTIPSFYSISNNKINECDIEDEDNPLNESKIEELCKRYKSLHYDLIHKGHRKNASELLGMLNV